MVLLCSLPHFILEQQVGRGRASGRVRVFRLDDALAFAVDDRLLRVRVLSLALTRLHILFLPVARKCSLVRREVRLRRLDAVFHRLDQVFETAYHLHRRVNKPIRRVVEENIPEDGRVPILKVPWQIPSRRVNDFFEPCLALLSF